MGRPDLFQDIDVSRSIGWFTALAPIGLSRSTGAPGQAALAQQLRDLPEQGLGHGLAMKFGAEKDANAAAPHPAISVNYLGRAETGTGAEQSSDMFTPITQDVGPRRASNGERPYGREISAVITDECFTVTLIYASDTVPERDMSALADTLQNALAAQPDAPVDEADNGADYDLTSIIEELTLD